MEHITEIFHHQMRFSSLKDSMSADNQVQFIDTFLMYLDSSKLGFTTKQSRVKGTRAIIANRRSKSSLIQNYFQIKENA